MLSDPIADMLTRIRNAYQASKETVKLPHSNIKESIAQVMKDKNYLKDFKVVKDGNKKFIELGLLYQNGTPSITSIKRISTCGRRIYKGKGELPYVLSGLGTAIISTSKGVMTETDARKQSLGGEIICEIW